MLASCWRLFVMAALDRPARVPSLTQPATAAQSGRAQNLPPGSKLVLRLASSPIFMEWRSLVFGQWRLGRRGQVAARACGQGDAWSDEPLLSSPTAWPRRTSDLRPSFPPTLVRISFLMDDIHGSGSTKNKK